MTKPGRVAFGLMEEVIWGTPAEQAVAELATKAGAERVFLMVSGTLHRETDVIHRIRAALGNKCAAVFDRMPPHTPRQAVIDAAEMARAADADLIVTIGGGSITDAAKAVQLCLANDIRSAAALDAMRPVKGPDGVVGPPPATPPRSARSPCPPHCPPGSSAPSPASPTNAPASRNCSAIHGSCPRR